MSGLTAGVELWPARWAGSSVEEQRILTPQRVGPNPTRPTLLAYRETIPHRPATGSASARAGGVDDLLDALKRGGSPVGGKTPKKTLYVSLVRGREVVPIPGQTGWVGLRKWYQKGKK